MMRPKEKLMSAENVQVYLHSLEKRFLGQGLTDSEQELTREINIALEYNPELEEELLDVFLAPVSSTYSGMKMIFHEKEDTGKAIEKIDAAVSFTESEWKFMRKAAAKGGKLYNTLRDKIDRLSLGRIEESKDTRKFFIDMPLDAAITLHLEVTRTGTQWLVIPTGPCPVVYKTDQGEEKMQT
ncbi:MAG: hypothetical protein JSV88_16100, partial [Candidatus Aminicenantes bacterium]